MAEKKLSKGARKKGEIGRPLFCHRDKILDAYEHLFGLFQLADPEMRKNLFAAVLVENSIILLTGTYGTGKTQFVNLVKKVMFSDGKGGYLYDYETCHQELTAFDVLYHLDLAELQKGKEVVHPKSMITARLKFFNEIQRAGTGFFNTLLPLLSEHRLTYRDYVFEVPDFVCIMDRNPVDAGSSDIPEAFLDRIDFGFEIPAIYLEEFLDLQGLRRQKHGFHWDGLEDMAQSIVTFNNLAEVWTDVKRVDIPDRIALLAGMISDTFRLCIMTERSIARMEYDLLCNNCQFQGEICSHLMKVPGQRMTNSMLRLSQALAWMDGAREVTINHVLSSLPWAIPHRLSLRPEELRKQPNEQAWVRETALGEIIRPKLPFWERALKAFYEGKQTELEKLGENDLVVRELHLLLLDQQ